MVPMIVVVVVVHSNPTIKLNRRPSIIYDLDSEECLTKARGLLLKH